jgi:hypothetical protein
MSGAAQSQPRPEPQGRWSRWLLGVTGVVLLVVAIVMMASNAPASRAQTIHPSLAPTPLARLRLPSSPGPRQAGTVSPHRRSPGHPGCHARPAPRTSGRRAPAAGNAYVAVFFGEFLWRQSGQLLDGPSPEYPGIVSIR